MEFSRQEYRSGLPFPTAGYLPNTENKSVFLESSALAGRSLLLYHLGSPESLCYCCAVAKLCQILYDPVDCSLPGFPVLSPGVDSDLYQLNHWCHSTISPSVAPFSCPQSFSESGPFPMCWLFASRGQSIGEYLCCHCSVTQLFPILCDPMKCSTPGFPVLHHLPELAQTHVHWVGDAIQPSHPVSSPSPPAFSLTQHQGLF